MLLFGVLLFTLIFNFWLTAILLPRLMNIISEAKFVRPNYRGKAIPLGGGLVFFLSCFSVSILTLGLAMFLLPQQQTVTAELLEQILTADILEQILTADILGLTVDFKLVVYHWIILLLGMAVMTLVGLLDDFFGNRASSGLVGHFRKFLLEGEITTGLLKAVMGVVLALAIVLLEETLVGYSATTLTRLGTIITKVLTIALSINLINLLDLRPGRAGKGFILGAIILAGLAWPWSQHPEIFFLVFVLASLAAYLPYDLHAGVMMGDCGANALGVVLGVVSSWVLAENILPIYLTVLVFVHLVTEKYSLTKIIANNVVLRYLDEAGQK